MKEETMVQTRNHLVRRSIVFCIGLIIMAFGVAFSIKATLGTSPISSLPYVTASISGLTVGTTTIIMNFAFVFLQIGICLSNPQKPLIFQGFTPVFHSNLICLPLFLPLRAGTRATFYSPPTTLSSSLAEVRFASLVE